MKISFILFSLLFVQAQAANVLTINVRNRFISESNPILDELSTSLKTGDLIQLGYFNDAAPILPSSLTFNNFVPVSDPTGNIARDLGFNDLGTFSGQASLDDGTNTPSASSRTLQFGLRFYNGTTLKNSTFFNTVTTSNWTFTFADESTPLPLPSFMDVSGFNQSSRDDIDSAVWQGLPFSTTVPVPEPSTSLSVLLGLGLLIGARRRM